MAVDKNLFLYDLAVVAIMKNEGPYVKEWLDYHINAGVDHFYIYDNDSSDNQREILQPYIERGIVTYIKCTGKYKQMEAYVDALNKYKFQCRYMSFIDGDEFILPQSNRSIVEVIDEIFDSHPHVAGVNIYWHCFGSNNQEAADYTHGVLERFTRRASDDSEHNNNACKFIANPRKIQNMATPHYAFYVQDFYSSNDIFQSTMADKIVINHYWLKSREEYIIRRKDNVLYKTNGEVDLSNFYKLDESCNEVFDDRIIKYRDVMQAKRGGAV